MNNKFPSTRRSGRSRELPSYMHGPRRYDRYPTHGIPTGGTCSPSVATHPQAPWPDRVRFASWRCGGGCCLSHIFHARWGRRFPSCRSEEHTSELQSHLNLVCRLLLEKKKKKKIK